MRTFLYISIVVLVVLISGLISCDEPTNKTNSKSEFSELLPDQIASLENRLAVEAFKFLSNEGPDSLNYYRSLYNYMMSDRQIFNGLREKLRVASDNSETRRKQELLFGRLLKGLIESDKKVESVRDSLVLFMSNEKLKFEGETVSAQEVASRLFYDRDRTQRELAYRSLSARGDSTADSFSRLFRLRNQAAKRLGYNDFFTMSLNANQYSVDEFQTIIDELVAGTLEEWVSFTDGIRRSNATADIEIWDIPFEYSKIMPSIDQFFPADSQFDYVQKGFIGIGFDLQALPIYVVDQSDISAPSFSATLGASAPFDQRVIFMSGSGLKALTNLAGQIGEAVHATHINQKDRFFRSIREDVWTRSMEQLIVDLTDSPEWLTLYAEVPEERAKEYAKASRLRELSDLRLTLVRLQFEYEAYQNPNRDLNKLYWDLFEDYMLLPRHDELSPWAATAEYVTTPAESYTHLVAKIVSAQTIEYLRSVQGSLIDNHETRAFLIQNYYRFGSRFSWADLVERGTGEELSADHLIARLTNK